MYLVHSTYVHMYIMEEFLSYEYTQYMHIVRVLCTYNTRTKYLVLRRTRYLLVQSTYTYVPMYYHGATWYYVPRT